MDIITDIAEAIYARAGKSPSKPPKRGAYTLMTKIHGHGVLWDVANAIEEGGLGKLAGRRHFMVRDGISDERRNFVIARLLARHELLDDSGYHAMSVVDRERLENEIAGWICAPPAAFVPAMKATGRNLRQLSFAFMLTETACALRIGEIEPDQGVAVTTPAIVHRKGRRFAWESDEVLRELANKLNPKSVRKVKIFDEPGRTALLSKAG